MSSTSVNLFYWMVDSAPEWQEALHYFSFVIPLHSNSLLCSFLLCFLAKSLIINFLSETTDWPTAFGKWQQIVLCIIMAWKCLCKQLDFLVWHVTGYNTTVFLSEIMVNQSFIRATLHRSKCKSIFSELSSYHLKESLLPWLYKSSFKSSLFNSNGTVTIVHYGQNFLASIFFFNTN